MSYQSQFGDIVHEGKYADIVNPRTMHIPQEDGGHLLVIPKREVTDRTKLNPIELLEIEYFSIIAAGVLKQFLAADWINYQENGNWGLDKPENQHMHLHIYGRKRGGKTQIYGEALRFPLKAERHLVSFASFSQRQIEQIKTWVSGFRTAEANSAFEKQFDLPPGAGRLK